MFDEIIEEAGLLIGKLIEEIIALFEFGGNTGDNAESGGEDLSDGVNELFGCLVIGLMLDVIIAESIVNGLVGIFEVVLGKGVGGLIFGWEFVF